MVRSSAYFHTVLAIIASLLLHGQAAEVTCYAPDGTTVAPNDSYVPCNKLGITQQGVYSSCCLLDGDPMTRDLCAQSGLCLRGGIVQREYCTDKQWKSPACVPICIDPAAGGSSNGTVELTPCTDGTFCCGKNNLTCCGTHYAISVTTQASVVVVQTATVTAAPSQTPDVAVLAGLCGAIGAVILISAGVIIYLRRKNAALRRKHAYLAGSTRHLDSSLPPTEPRPMSYMPSSTAPTIVAPSTHIASMQDFAAFKAFMGYQAATEIQSNPRYSELDATTMAAARHLSRLSLQPPTTFEQLRETPVEHETDLGLSPPTGPPPARPGQGFQGGHAP